MASFVQKDVCEVALRHAQRIQLHVHCKALQGINQQLNGWVRGLAAHPAHTASCAFQGSFEALQGIIQQLNGVRGLVAHSVRTAACIAMEHTQSARLHVPLKAASRFHSCNAIGSNAPGHCHGAHPEHTAARSFQGSFKVFCLCDAMLGLCSGQMVKEHPAHVDMYA
eukprot:1158365-Pelagomonas_calceolata.AAC.1